MVPMASGNLLVPKVRQFDGSVFEKVTEYLFAVNS
jgi:hypothetical protein